MFRALTGSGEMERHEQGRAADVHSKHSIYPTFILMEGLVKTRGSARNPRWPRWLSRVRAVGRVAPGRGCLVSPVRRQSYGRGCLCWEMSCSWVSEIWGAQPSFPAATCVTWGKSLHFSIILVSVVL